MEIKLKIFIRNPEDGKMIPIIDSGIYFYSDSDDLLLAEDIIEVIDPMLLEDLENAE